MLGHRKTPLACLQPYAPVSEPEGAVVSRKERKQKRLAHRLAKKDSWNTGMDALGARRGTWEQVEIAAADSARAS